MRAIATSKRIRRRFVDVEPGSSTFGDALATLHESYVRLVTGMFPLSSAIGPPLSILRRSGTLDEHAARHRTITTEMADAMLALGHDPSALDGFLERFGHRGVYESDVARPRYTETTDMLANLPASADERALPARTVRGVLTVPVWVAARRPMAARELLRHDAMRAFAAVRIDLLRLAGDAVAAGQLRSVDDIWLLEADEVRRLDDGWSPTPDFWVERERERARLAELVVPTTVDADLDPEAWHTVGAHVGDAIVGMGLTAGTVSGRAWVLDEPAVEPPPADGEPIVLIARSIDAGWISTMTAADAVVAEIGGDLSHGSILIRELGLPAVTNARGDVVRTLAGPTTPGIHRVVEKG